MREKSSIKFEIPVPWSAKAARIHAAGVHAVIAAAVVAVVLLVVIWAT